MKVKIGNKIYEASKEPILLILNEKDKDNLSVLISTGRTYYCAYPENRNVAEIVCWIQETEEKNTLDKTDN